MKPFKAIFQVACGNFLEMYDFMVFGYYAPEIARAFFPSENEFTSLMLSLATFGAGFLMRPLGGLILGIYVDRHGRRKGLLLTLALMSIGTLSIACMPTYASIGAMAPLLVLLGRLLQGFSAGVELGGVSVYLAEIATKGRKGFYVSWQSASQQVAVIFAAAVGVILHLYLPPQELNDWGWRIPFFVGCMIVPFLFYVRTTLKETAEFLEKKQTHSIHEMLASILRNWRVILQGTLIAILSTVFFYLITAYTPTFGSTVLHLSALNNLTVTLCVGISNLFWVPFMGHISDFKGRKPILIGASLLTALTAYPALAWLTHDPSFGHLLGVELWFSALYGSYNGAAIVYLTELMPFEVKTSGFSLAYSIAVAFFGGFTPAISTYLVHETHLSAAPAIWLTFAAILGLIAVADFRKLVK